MPTTFQPITIVNDKNHGPAVHDQLGQISGTGRGSDRGSSTIGSNSDPSERSDKEIDVACEA